MADEAVIVLKPFRVHGIMPSFFASLRYDRSVVNATSSVSMSIANAIALWNRRRLQRRKFERDQQQAALNYERWVGREAMLSLAQLARVAEADVAADLVFSVLLPVRRLDWGLLQASIASVLAQTHRQFELCIVWGQGGDGGDAAATSALRQLAASDGRVKLHEHEPGLSLAAACNRALARATGEHVICLHPGDLLAAFALSAIGKAVVDNPSVGLIYADEDQLDAQGRRVAPHFKPDWNEFLLRSHHYIGQLRACRRQLVLDVGGLCETFAEAPDYDLTLRCVERLQASQVVHVPLVLGHVQQRPDAGSAAMQAHDLQALRAHLARRGVLGEVVWDGQGRRVRYALPNPLPKVSLVILTRDRPQLLDSCVRSVLDKTVYANIEVLIVDNGTVDAKALRLLDQFAKDERVRILRDPSPFNFSALNNRAVAQATGEFLCLLNNDIEVLSTDWLQEMVSVAAQPGVGAVGTRLWFPDGRIQHAGVILGIGGAAGHPFRLQKRQDTHYMGRPQLMQELSAVTAACLVTPKALFEQVGGMDEEAFQVAFNDVDYCLKVRREGLRVVYTPYAELVHHESVSRGYEDTDEKKRRFMVERQHLIDRWPEWLAHDPAYNPNLTLERDNFALAAVSRMTPARWFGLDA